MPRPHPLSYPHRHPPGRSPGGYIFIDSENPPNHRGAAYHQLWHWLQFTSQADTWYIFTAGNPKSGHYCREHLVAAGAPPDAIHVMEIHSPAPDIADHNIILRFIDVVPHGFQPPPRCLLMTRDRGIQLVFGYLALEKGVRLQIVRGREYLRGQARQGELLVAVDWKTGKIAPVPLPDLVPERKQRHLALNIIATAFRSNPRMPGLTPKDIAILNDRYARWLQPFSITEHLRNYFPAYPLETKGLSRRAWETLRIHLAARFIHNWFEKHPNAPFLPPNALMSIRKTWSGLFNEMSPEVWDKLLSQTRFCPRQGIARPDCPRPDQLQKTPNHFHGNSGFQF